MTTVTMTGEEYIALKEKADLYDFLRFSDPDESPAVMVSSYGGWHRMSSRQLRGKKLDEAIRRAIKNEPARKAALKASIQKDRDYQAKGLHRL